MTINGWIQILVFTLLVLALVKPLGGYMTRVFTGEPTILSPVLRPLERGLYALAGIDEHQEQHWLAYTIAMLVFHVGGFLILYAVLRLQAILPFNPAEHGGGRAGSRLQHGASFITNTNWQNYGGESTLSYLAQMLGLTHQNFLSAATGIVLAVALIRGFARASFSTVGCFWVDVTRCTLYVLLPLCIPYTLFLVWQGIPQTLAPMLRRQRSKARSRRSRSGRSRPRSQSRCWAPTAAASSTPMPPTRSRTRPPWRTSSRWCPSSPSAQRSRTFRPHGRQRAPGLGHPGRHGPVVSRGVTVAYWAEAAGNPALTHSGSRAATWKARRSASGSPTRPCSRP